MRTFKHEAGTGRTNPLRDKSSKCAHVCDKMETSGDKYRDSIVWSNVAKLHIALIDYLDFGAWRALSSWLLGFGISFDLNLYSFEHTPINRLVFKPPLFCKLSL